MLKYFRSATTSNVYKNLCFKVKDIAKHSVKPEAEIIMFEANVPIFKIMLADKWYSDALLKYIRKHTMDFSKGSSSRMINNDLLNTLQNYGKPTI